MRRPSHLLAALAFAMSPPALADPLYTITAVAGADSAAADLNIVGQVVGWMAVGEQSHAFVSSGTSLTDLGTLDGSASWATSINDHGQIVGDAYVTNANGDQFVHGFSYSGGVMSALPGAGYQTADGINDAGTVIGSMAVPTAGSDGEVHAYTYAGGSYTDLGTLPIGDGSRALGINSAGEVVGAAASTINGVPNLPEDPFLYHKGKMIDLGTLDPNGIWNGATAINDHGQIVGYAGLGESMIPGDIYPRTAFQYENGVMKNLGGLGPGWSSVADDINNLGQIVGTAWLSDLSTHGFLYQNGKMIDLNTLIDPATGWTIESAAAINDLGRIAATACRDGVCQAVRLDLVPAVPEPSVHALLLAGLALGGRRAVPRLSSPALRRPG